MTTPTRDLSVVRLRLTKMTDRILMRLHDRAGFPLNRAVYEPGRIPIPGRPGVSLLDFAVEGLESYHASLGRYDFPDQFPLSAAGKGRETGVQRVVPAASERLEIALRDDLVEFYTKQILPRLCTDADDPDTYGETAYADADLLELLNERVNVGRDIARAKVERDPDLEAIIADEPELRERLTDRPREQLVLAEAAASAARYGLDPNLARMVFEWVIGRTLSLEVEFLQRLRAG